MRAAKVQASLRIRAVSPEPSLLAHRSSESRGTFRQKARSLAPLNGWACAVKMCHDGMLEDTNSLDGAQIVLCKNIKLMLQSKIPQLHFGLDLLSFWHLSKTCFLCITMVWITFIQTFAYQYLVFVCLCWGLTFQSTILQSCRDGATASWVINQYFWGVKCLARGHNMAAVGFEPPTSRSGVRHSTTEPPLSPILSINFVLKCAAKKWKSAKCPKIISSYRQGR